MFSRKQDQRYPSPGPNRLTAVDVEPLPADDRTAPGPAVYRDPMGQAMVARGNSVHSDETVISSDLTIVGNVISQGRVRLEGSIEGVFWGVRVKASATGQRPRDEDTGLQLQGRSEYFGRLEASKSLGSWSLSGGITASAERYDSPNEAAGTRLPGYAIADATLRYAAGKGWAMELTAANLFDKSYEHAVGYDAPRRSVLFNVRFETF